MRRLAILCLVLLLPIACGDDDDPAIAAGASTTTTAIGGDPGTTVATTAPGDQPAPTTPAGRPATTLGPSDPATPDTSGPPGSAAPFYLRPAPATSVVVEVSAEAGAEPGAATLDHLVSVLGRVSGKPVQVGGGGALPSREAWTASQLRDAAAAAAVVPQGDHAVIRLLFVHGRYADADDVLGVSVRGDVAAIFSDGVDAAASPLVGPGAIETAVTTHEVGHLLGLVDLYLQTGRGDPEHPGHSTNHDSVMFWAVESTLVTDLLAGGPPRDFDEADLNDLQTIRNGP